MISELRHQHIVEIYDAGESEGLPYLVLELCDGGNLRRAMAGQAGPTERLRWLEEIAAALAFAHDKGIVHRDVKPENVVLTSSGSIKVADFGIAKALECDRPTENTTQGIVGTPRYMAPEQLAGEPIDARVDQFAWGLVAYELMTGTHPRLGGTAGRDTSKIPGHLLPVLTRATAPNPAHRYPSIHALLADLHRRPRKIPRIAALFGTAGIAAAIVIGANYAPIRAKQDAGRHAHHSTIPNNDKATALANTGSVFAADTVPETVRPEARNAYSAAVQLWVDASPQEALRKLDHATSVDESFARAHLLYALIDEVTPAAREHYQLAAQYRAQLSEREIALLDAIAPSLRDPLDLEETRRRLERLEQEFPRDPDIPLFIANRYLLAWDGAGALSFAERAVAGTQPVWPIARLMRARSLAKLNQLDASRDEYARCFASSPSATGCLRWNAKLDAGDGRCASVERLARQLIAAAPNNGDGYYFLAGALAGQAGAVSATRSALEPRWNLGPTAIRDWVRAQDTFQLQVSTGAFDDAERTLDVWEAEGALSTNADHRGRPAVQRLLLNLELGRHRRAAALARSYLEQSRAWAEGEDIVFDIEAYRVLYFAGAFSKSEFAQKRDEWLVASAQRRTGWQDMPLYLWYEAFVEAVVDREDAVLAISRRPPNVQEPDRELLTAQATQRFGRMYLLAGQLDAALQYLKRATDECSFKYPLHQMWANLDYATASAKQGNSAAALKSIHTILDRWGNVSRSKTSEEARSLLKRLQPQ